MGTQDLAENRTPIKSTLIGILHQNWIRPISIAVVGGLIVLGLGSVAITNISQSVPTSANGSVTPAGFLGLWKQVNSFNGGLTFLVGIYLSILTLKRTNSGTSKNKNDSVGEVFIILAIGYWWLFGSLLSVISQIVMWKIFGWLPNDPEIANLAATAATR